jgi:hypothetical protein
MLKKALLIVAVVFGSLLAVHSSNADDWVRGYYRSSGTYVQPHYRSTADGYFSNNWSTYPNINPYTGSIGTRRTPSYGTYPSFGSSRSYGGYSSPYRSYWGR